MSVDWPEEIESAGRRLAALAASAFAAAGPAFLVRPMLRSPQRLFVVAGTLDDIVRLASRGLGSPGVHALLRDELIVAAGTCLERQGAAALLVPLDRPGSQCFIAAGSLDQISDLATSQRRAGVGTAAISPRIRQFS